MGVEEGMPRPALSRLWRRVVTEEGVRPAPKEACASAGGGGRAGPLQGFSGVADGALRRWDLYWRLCGGACTCMRRYTFTRVRVRPPGGGRVSETAWVEDLN